MPNATLKRYWSADYKNSPAYQHAKKAQRFEMDAFDAELSPDDIREMQTIDADCNDCAHFKRGAMIKVPGLTYFRGHCKKTDSPTNAFSGQFSGHPCFQHRRKDHA